MSGDWTPTGGAMHGDSVLFFCLRFSAFISVDVTTTMVLAENSQSRVSFVSGFDRFGRHANIDEATVGRNALHSACEFHVRSRQKEGGRKMNRNESHSPAEFGLIFLSVFVFLPEKTSALPLTMSPPFDAG